MSQLAYPSTPQAGSPGQRPTVDPFEADGRSGPDYNAIPYRRTPPWDELPIWEESDTGIVPLSAPNIARVEDLHARVNLAFGNEALPLVYYLDEQYGYPPPGAYNDQSFQSGHTQVTVHNQSAEQGWGADPAFTWPRYPHMENHARAYSWGVARRNGGLQAPKGFAPIYSVTQQTRDSMLRNVLRHALHQHVVSDAATVPNTMNIVQTSPYYVPDPIGAGGVLPE